MNQVSKKHITTKDGVRLYYDIHGDTTEAKPKTLFIHGVGGDIDAWQYVRKILSTKDLITIAMDLRGHGYSSHPRALDAYTAEKLNLDILAILDNENISKVVLIGHSYGAFVALNFSLAHGDRLEKLILLSPTNRGPNYIQSIVAKKIAIALVNVLAFTSLPPINPGHSIYPVGKFHKDFEWFGLARTILRNSLASYLLSSKETIQSPIELERLHSLNLPTLIVSGEKDSVFPTPIAREIHESIPDSIFLTIPSANHVTPLNNIDEISNMIFEFTK